MTNSAEPRSQTRGTPPAVSPRGPLLLALGCAVCYALFVVLAYLDGAPHHEPPQVVDGRYVDPPSLFESPLGMVAGLLVMGPVAFAGPFVAIGTLMWGLVACWQLGGRRRDRASLRLAIGAVIVASLVVSFALSPTMQALMNWVLD